MSTTETPVLTPAQEAAQAVADPKNPQDQWKANFEQVMKSIVGLIPFRHEGEANRILLALDHLHENIDDVLASVDPIAPTQGQPDPVLLALVKKAEDTDAKFNQVLDLLRNLAPAQAAAIESGAAVETDPTPAPVETAVTDGPPGWTKDPATGEWVQVPAEQGAGA